MPRSLLPATLLLVAIGAHLAAAEPDRESPERQVEAVEQAFARAMAERDFEAFQSFLSEEAVFLGGGGALRGKRAVAERWSAFFEGPEAPFSWRPETVEVLDSGRLAISTGPVFDSAGERISTYTSIWRLEEPRTWRIIFDRGNKYCE